VAEVEVLAHHDQAGAQRADQHLLDEVLGSLVGPLAVEGDHQGAVDAAVGQQLQLLLEVGELRGRRGGAHHAGRMAVEGDHHGREPPGRRQRRQLVQQGPVPEVHAVVGPDGHSGSGHRGRD
jgi:hypothetical protein